MRRYPKNKQGSILILSLWVVAFLAVIAANIGLGIRGRAMLLSRLEDRSKLHYLADAGVKKAISLIRSNYSETGVAYSLETKSFLHNNPLKFKEISLGEGTFSVSYVDNEGGQKGLRYYGVVDEDRKININTADKATLTRLMEQAVTTDNEIAQSLAEAIIDWREIGESRATGFYSDDYYANLKDPYQPKKADFEVIDELKLVKGFSESIFAKIKPYVTIYSDGKININTAPKEVLVAIGMDYILADKVLAARRGKDGVDATGDDYVFTKAFDIASELNGIIELTKEEHKLLDSLNTSGLLKVSSEQYYIESTVRLGNKNQTLRVDCVYGIKKGRVEYWREK